MLKESPNLNNLSVEELTQLIAEAQAKREDLQQGARAQLIEEMTTKAAQLGLSLEALVGAAASPKGNARKVRGDKGESVAAKYKGPGDETWSGRGRIPRWLTAAIERGQKKEDFAA